MGQLYNQIEVATEKNYEDTVKLLELPLGCLEVDKNGDEVMVVLRDEVSTGLFNGYQ